MVIPVAGRIGDRFHKLKVVAVTFVAPMIYNLITVSEVSNCIEFSGRIDCQGPRSIYVYSEKIHIAGRCVLNMIATIYDRHGSAHTAIQPNARGIFRERKVTVIVRFDGIKL